MPCGAKLRQIKNRHWGVKGASPLRWMESQHRRRSVRRRVRLTLLRKRPMVLQTSRWSQSHRFLKTMVSELSNIPSHNPPVILSLKMRAHDSLEATWHHFLEELNGLLPESDPPIALSVMAERKGFRYALTHFFSQLSLLVNKPVALFMDEVERFPMSFVEDVQRSWMNAFEDIHQDDVVPLLMAGAIEGGLFQTRIWLSDYGEKEVSAILANDTMSERQLRHPIYISGGIPALVDPLIPLAIEGNLNNQDLRMAWNHVEREISSVVDLVSARKEMARRLQKLADNDPLPTIDALDGQLAEAGLVRIVAGGNQKKTELRAPYFRKFLS